MRQYDLPGWVKKRFLKFNGLAAIVKLRDDFYPVSIGGITSSTEELVYSGVLFREDDICSKDFIDLINPRAQKLLVNMADLSVGIDGPDNVELVQSIDSIIVEYYDLDEEDAGYAIYAQKREV